MKTILILIGCYTLCLLSEVRAQSPAEEDVSFYRTNLVCAAAPDIGCGTRAKPLLKKFNEHEGVDAAYLNHSGTVVAIVWKEDTEDRQNVAKAIFADDKRSFEEIYNDNRQELLEDFHNGKWYMGDEVDQLSMIEAGRIASQLTNWIDGEASISESDMKELHNAFEEYVKKEFLSIEDDSVIDQPSYWQRWQAELREIGQATLGDRMPELNFFSLADDSQSDGKSKACCTSKSANTACCTKTSKPACCTKANTSACCKSN